MSAPIDDRLPTQRGNVSLTNRDVVNAILRVPEYGCKWRGLHKRLGNLRMIHTRMHCWGSSGVLDRVFDRLQEVQVVRIKTEAVCPDSTMFKIHPGGTVQKKSVRSPSENLEVNKQPRFIWLPRMPERL